MALFSIAVATVAVAAAAEQRVLGTCLCQGGSRAPIPLTIELRGKTAYTWGIRLTSSDNNKEQERDLSFEEITKLGKSLELQLT